MSKVQAKKIGRPFNKGPHGESTKPIRIPISMISTVQKIMKQRSHFIPLYSSKVPAGFPSALEDPIEDKIDLNDLLIKHPAATFLVQATGNSMIDAGINQNDYLIVDRSINPTNGRIVVAAIDGHLTVKYFFRNADNELILKGANPDFKPIKVKETSEVVIWGVVTNIIHSA